MLPTKPSSNKTKQKTNLALHNTIPPSCSKSERNPNGEVVATNTASTLKQIFKGPIISYRTGHSFTDIIVRAKIYRKGKKTNKFVLIFFQKKTLKGQEIVLNN